MVVSVAAAAEGVVLPSVLQKCLYPRGLHDEASDRYLLLVSQGIPAQIDLQASSAVAACLLVS